MEQPLLSLNLPSYKLLQLNRLGYYFVKDLSPTDEKVNNILQSDWEFVNKKTKTKTALELIQEETTHGTIITFIKSLDQLLGNGVPLKQITEFCGLPGSGKSQISYLLCINVQFPYWCGGVEGEAIYLCTKYGFNSKRVRDIATKTVSVFQNLKNSYKFINLDEFNRSFNVDSILSKIFHIHIDNDLELIATINMLEQWISTNQKVKIIVIDSITAPVRHAPIESRAEIVNQIIHRLKILAQKYNLAVVVTNELTTKFCSNNEVSTAPSFGSTYFHKINTRVELSKLSRDVFQASLTKSVTMPYSQVSFQLP